jgi:hypothetical protein
MRRAPNHQTKRVKPEDGFHQHVQRGGEIVAAEYVPNFVGENGFQVRITGAFRNVFGPHQNGPAYAKNAGFQRSW